MTDAGYTSRDTSAPYEVGYGKPPRHTQFRKGRSGNPGGRPRGLPVQRANALLLQEAYRAVAIKEDGRMVPVSAMQAIMRSQVELAINGHFRAQREILQAVQSIERSKAYGAYMEVYKEDDTDDDETDDDETDDDGDPARPDRAATGGRARSQGSVLSAAGRPRNPDRFPHMNPGPTKTPEFPVIFPVLREYRYDGSISAKRLTVGRGHHFARFAKRICAACASP